MMRLNKMPLSTALLGVLGVCSMDCYATESSLGARSDAGAQASAPQDSAQSAAGGNDNSRRGSGGSADLSSPSRFGASREPHPADAGNRNAPDAGEVGSEGSGLACKSHHEKECDRFIPYTCEAGSHLDVVPEEACPVCVPDDGEEPSCKQGRARYPDFLDELERQSCVSYCEQDTDCVVSELSNACEAGVLVALHGLVNEELILAAAAFAEDNCAACGSQASEAVPSEREAVCANHRCELRSTEN